MGFAVVKSSTMRGVFPRVDSSPLAIINIRLKAVDADGDPANSVHQFLKIFFAGRVDALKYFVHDFDIDPEDPSCLEAHQQALDETVRQIQACVYHQQWPS
jgi:hypothetical protein